MRPPIVDGIVTKAHDQATYFTSYWNHCFRCYTDNTEKRHTLAYYKQYETDGVIIHSGRTLFDTGFVKSISHLAPCYF